MTLLFEIHSCTQVSGSFRFLQGSPYFAAEPLEITGGSQLGSPGRRPARVEEIRRGPAAGPAGDGRGVVLGYSWPDSNRSAGLWCPGRVARRWRLLQATVCPTPASFRPGHANEWRGRLQRMLGVVLGRLLSRGS
jgi:hypothetical protein